MFSTGQPPSPIFQGLTAGLTFRSRTPHTPLTPSALRRLSPPGSPLRALASCARRQREGYHKPILPAQETYDISDIGNQDLFCL